MSRRCALAMPPDGQAVGRTASGPDAVLIAPVVDDNRQVPSRSRSKLNSTWSFCGKRDQEPIIIPTGAALDARPESAFEVRCSDGVKRGQVVGPVGRGRRLEPSWSSLSQLHKDAAPVGDDACLSIFV